MRDGRPRCPEIGMMAGRERLRGCSDARVRRQGRWVDAAPSATLSNHSSGDYSCHMCDTVGAAREYSCHMWGAAFSG